RVRNHHDLIALALGDKQRSWHGNPRHVGRAVNDLRGGFAELRPPGHWRSRAERRRGELPIPEVIVGAVASFVADLPQNDILYGFDLERTELSAAGYPISAATGIGKERVAAPRLSVC